MTQLRFIASALAAASFMMAPAQNVVPGAPSLSVSFEIDGDVGKVVGTVTTPVKDNQWTDLPAETQIDIRVVRSCYYLQETEIAVFSVSGLTPGESYDFTDNATPAWQYGYQYTYMAYASINGNEGMPGYGTCSPGIQFSFGYGDVTATPGEENGAFFVGVSAIVPEMTNQYPPQVLDVDMTALEFYRTTDPDSEEPVLLHTEENPEKGKTYEFIDRNPVENCVNYYIVKCLSKFGATEQRVEAFVGFDVPEAPLQLKGDFIDDGGYRLSWTPPTRGFNSGQIKEEDTFYNVYRCWGRTEDERELIAGNLKATEYVDYGTDMELPRAVMYMVQSANDLGVGGSSSSSWAYDVLIGPDYRLPFVETFDDGEASRIWTYENTSYYAAFEAASYAEYDDTRVDPVSGTGLAYVDFSYSWIAEGSSATMTSYKIDMSKAVAPYLSFYIYMIPGCDVTVKPQISAEGGDFADLATIEVGDCEETEWRQFTYDLAEYAGKGYINICFYGGFTSMRAAAIIDEIMIVDYPAVKNIEVSYDPEVCGATLTWEDPSAEYAVVTGYEGIVDGNSVGTVENPWMFRAEDYHTPYKVSVKAIYGDITGPESDPVTVSVPRPAITEFTVENHVFSIVQDTDPGINQVFVKEYLGSEALYKVPELVKNDDVSYTVTGIGEGAYRENESLASVNIPETVAVVEAEAFFGCRGLMAVAFGKGLEKIGTRAFAECSSLSMVTFVSETVPEVATDAFSGIADPCSGKCPEGTEDDYSAVEGLYPITFGTDGIGFIFGDSAEKVEYYDYSGIRLTAPAAGTPVIIRALMPDGTIRISRNVIR